MERYYKTELHTHTSPVSSCSDIEAKKWWKYIRKTGMTA